jgi:hypothetical protein
MLKRLTPMRLIVLVGAIVLILLSWQQVRAAQNGLIVRHVNQDGLPLRFIVAEGVEDAPGVVVAHGFAGSQQLMLAYGYALANAGYGVILLDFAGHGANGVTAVRESDALTDNVALATAVLQSQPEIDRNQLALLGHSMGSRAILEAGVNQGDLYRATIAVSPGNVESVNENWPRNLLLTAGLWERPFLENAEAVFARAGGPNPDFSQDRARALLSVPNAEHISILFRPLSHDAARDWLDNVFGVQRVSAYRDTRMVWYGVHLLAWLAALLAVSPLLPKGAAGQGRRKPWYWLGLVAGVVGGTAVTWLLSRVFNLDYLGGVAVAGTLGLWFLFVGLIWLGSGFRPQAPSRRALLWGLALFAALWLAFGLLAHWVWLPWLLIPARLLRWLPLALTFIPWLLAAGTLQQGATPLRRLGWWAWQSILIVPALVGLVFLVPGVAFLALIAPVIPIVLGVMGIVAAAIDDAWAYALGGALFFSWTVLAVFPLAG